MRSNYIGLFDVIGPVMIGPSSSHTSGAASIAWMARQIFSGTPVKVDFTLYGSFADTYKGHGTDRALVGGILGYRSNDVRIRNSFEHAKEAGMLVSFTADRDTEVSHPNTVDILMENEEGHKLLVRGESLGGGRVRITRMNNIRVEFTGEYSTLIVGHRDESGTVAFITSRLANHQLNIAYMKMFRESKERGGNAFTVIESDDFLPEELKDELLSYPTIGSVDIIEL
jgi:L-serine dehydratase